MIATSAARRSAASIFSRVNLLLIREPGGAFALRKARSMLQQWSLRDNACVCYSKGVGPRGFVSNVGIFFVSRTTEQALDYVKGDYDVEPNLLLTLDYSCALFWLAAFTPIDEVRVAPESRWVDSADAAEFSIYLAPTAAAMERLRLRKTAVLSVLPKQTSQLYNDYYEQWIDLLEHHPGYVALNPVEVVALGDQAQAEGLLRRAIRVLAETPEADVKTAWQTLDPKAIVMPLDVDFRYENASATAVLWRNILAGGDAAGWPPPPSHAELRMAAPPSKSLIERFIDRLKLAADRWFRTG